MNGSVIPFVGISSSVLAMLTKACNPNPVTSPLPATWRRRTEYVRSLLSRITAQTLPARVPVHLFYVPDRPQAALAMPRYSRPGTDAFALPKALRDIAAGTGVTVVDTTADFAAAANFASLFYLADGHPTGDGDAVIAHRVAETLLSEPYFGPCRATARVPM